jgi:hypothetical protein
VPDDFVADLIAGLNFITDYFLAAIAFFEGNRFMKPGIKNLTYGFYPFNPQIG